MWLVDGYINGFESLGLIHKYFGVYALPNVAVRVPLSQIPKPASDVLYRVVSAVQGPYRGTLPLRGTAASLTVEVKVVVGFRKRQAVCLDAHEHMEKEYHLTDCIYNQRAGYSVTIMSISICVQTLDQSSALNSQCLDAH